MVSLHHCHHPPTNLISIAPHDLLHVARRHRSSTTTTVKSRRHRSVEYRCCASRRRSFPLPHPCLLSFWFDGCLKTTIKTKIKQTTQSNPVPWPMFLSCCLDTALDVLQDLDALTLKRFCLLVTINEAFKAHHHHNNIPVMAR
jgi:hypothetical protein